MNICKDSELKEIYGGETITGTVIDGFVDLIKLLYEAGKSAGSSIRRIVYGDICPLE